MRFRPFRRPATMTTNAHYRDLAPLRLQDEEERSIGTAMRATLCFVAIVVLLLWAGVSDAARASAAPAAVVAVRTG